MAAVAVWGVCVWGFHPAQTASLISAGGTRDAPVTLSLNTSVMYIGFSLDSMVGAQVIERHGVSHVALAAALIEGGALLLFLAWRVLRRKKENA